MRFSFHRVLLSVIAPLAQRNTFRQIRFPEMVGVAGRDEAIKLPKVAGRIATIPKRGKSKGHYVPHLVCKEDVEAIVLLDKQPSPSLALPAIWHVDRLEAYLSGHLLHEHNRLTISSCLDEIDAQFRKRGAGTKSLDITNKQKQYRDMRDRFHTFEKMCAQFCQPKQSLRCKRLRPGRDVKSASAGALLE